MAPKKRKTHRTAAERGSLGFRGKDQPPRLPRLPPNVIPAAHLRYILQIVKDGQGNIPEPMVEDFYFVQRLLTDVVFYVEQLVPFPGPILIPREAEVSLVTSLIKAMDLYFAQHPELEPLV